MEATSVSCDSARTAGPIAGTSSEVANFSGRDYDYGSGLSYRAGMNLLRNGRSLLGFRSEGSWLHTMNGAPGSYFITINNLQATVPLYRDLGVGGEIRGYYRKAHYDEFANVSRWLPEGRLFLTLGSR